jgi:hypothetical protein
VRLAFVLAVNVAFGIVADLETPGTASAQTSIGFTHPDSMGALLSYRLPDWGYRTIHLNFGLLGNGYKNSGFPASLSETQASASQALNLQWFRESEQRTWSLFGRQSGSWNWNQTSQEPEDAIASILQGTVSAGAYSRNYISGNLFMFGSASANAQYREQRAQEDSNRDLSIRRDFSGALNLGAGLGRMRDVTPVLQAERINERLQALGRPPVPLEDVLRLASVLAKRGGYDRVFDRPDRQLWRDVLEPLIARGETLSPFETYYLGDVFQEALGSRREGVLVNASASLQRETENFANSYSTSFGVTYWGPSVGMEWSHNLNLDHQLSASGNVNYYWLDFDNGAEGERGVAFVSLAHQWVVADRFLWSNGLSGNLTYNEITAPAEVRTISRQKAARLLSVFSFYVEDRIRLAPSAEVNWTRQEFEETWREQMSWHLEFNIVYDLENRLF